MEAKETNRIKIVVALWYLWSEKNQIREEGKRRSAEILARSIRSYANEVARTFIAEKQIRMKTKKRWTRPPKGVLKLNCDASFKGETNSGSWGFVIRDHNAEVVVTVRGKLDFALSAF